MKFPSDVKRMSKISFFIHLTNCTASLAPFYNSRVSAGFPSPADDYIEERLSIDDIIQLNPISTFLVQAQGDSMVGAGIKDKSYLVIDRSLLPKNNDIIIVSINGDFTVKRYCKQPDGQICLIAENPKYNPIFLTEDFENIFWGVVTCILNPLRQIT